MSKLSRCHNVPVNVYHGEDGTNHFTCSRCNEPCDLAVPPTNSVTPEEQELSDKLSELFNVNIGETDPFLSLARYIQTQRRLNLITANSPQLKEQATKILVACAERGNLYDGYVSSAEFNVEAQKIVDTYLPMLMELIEQTLQTQRRLARIEEVQETIGFLKRWRGHSTDEMIQAAKNRLANVRALEDKEKS